MKLEDIPDKEPLVPVTVRLHPKTKEALERLKERVGKPKVSEWIRLLIEKNVAEAE